MTTFRRRQFLLPYLLSASLLLAGCGSMRLPFAGKAAPAGPPPIIFVHGNGDNASLWQTTVWRFESNGWPRDRLFAYDLAYPLARDDDAVAQPGRTSTAEARQQLAAQIERVRRSTGASRVILIANSRGGYAVRSYLDEGGASAAAKVSHAVLGGTPNHGVRADAGDRPGNEFNGAGPFLTRLNRPRGAAGLEVTPGVQWLTIRSDNNDKFAQPTGEWIGAKGKPTNVSYDGPALKGASNVVIPGIDHRETSYGAQAFEQTFRFLTGRPPTTLAITPENRVWLNGFVFGSGLANQPGGGNFANNLPLVGANVEVFAVDPASGQRRGGALLSKTISADGQWGPLETDPTTPLEFVVAAPGFANTHVYRSPFPRSSGLVHLRAERIAPADRDAKAIVTLTRPRGYFGIPRDEISLDNKNPPPGIPAGVAGVSASKLLVFDSDNRPVAGSFNGERIVGRLWPAAANHTVTLELTH
ncbi:twin-arginine translocation pathway signal [Piscinibacter sakaiensis]|uniref:twin-arginine translocation pathway signal n=1 Tax=Piscinibacter sakaiensis TaxID=1547922 RepID=UPI003AADBB49